MSKEAILKFLKEQYGIKSAGELEAALRSADKINVGIMTTRTGEKKGD